MELVYNFLKPLKQILNDLDFLKPTVTKLPKFSKTSIKSGTTWV